MRGTSVCWALKLVTSRQPFSKKHTGALSLRPRMRCGRLFCPPIGELDTELSVFDHIREERLTPILDLENVVTGRILGSGNL